MPDFTMPNTEPSILSSTRGQRPAEPGQEKVRSEAETGGSAKLRCVGALVGVGCAAIMVAAWHLEPKWLPFGAQTQLSLPGCALQERTGYPCPTCGMTRAWGQAVRGNLLAAFRANIAGTILAIGCVLGLFAALGTAVGGRGVYGRFVEPLTGALSRLQWLYAGLGLIVLAWAWNGLWAFVKQQEWPF